MAIFPCDPEPADDEMAAALAAIRLCLDNETGDEAVPVVINVWGKAGRREGMRWVRDWDSRFTG